MRKFILFLFVTIAVSQAPQSFKLKDINVEGNMATSENMVLYTAGLQAGQDVSQEDFRRAVKRLWELGVFSNIQIHFDGETPDGILITIELEESPVLGSVKFQGNKKLKDKKFSEELSYQRGMRLKPNFITKSINTMKQMYMEDGYFLATIKAETETVGKGDDQKQNITFKIREGKKVKIKDIVIDGRDKQFGWVATKKWIPLPKFLREKLTLATLRWQMKETKIRSWWRLWAPAYDNKKFLEDLDLLTTFYRDEGYRDFTILSDSVYYEPKKRGLVVHLNVDEGEKYKYRNFTWEGNTLYETEILDKALNLSSGDAFSQSGFDKAVFEEVQSLYMDRGYLYSNIEPFFTPVGEDSIDVHFSITENNQVYIRNINIYGNEKTRENVIRRELDVFPGDLFRRTLLQRSMRKLHVLNYFDPTSLSPNVVPVDEDEVDLDITLEEKSSDKASANVGFTGIYGMTGGGNIEFNNFLGKGQVLSFGFDIGTQMSVYNAYGTPAKYESFHVRFMDPMFKDTPNRIGFSLGYQFRGQGNSYYFYPFDQRTRYGSLQWGRRLKWPDDYFRAFWEITVRQTEYMGDEDVLEDYIGSFRKSTGINLTQSISRDSRDRAEFPTQGSTASIVSTFSGGSLGGDEHYHKHVLSLDWYTPTFWKFVLTSSLKMGMIRKLDVGQEFTYIPPYERFIMGGNGIPYGTMLRGYPDNSIGPLTAQGRGIGGNTVAKYSTEFRFPFSENPVVYAMLFAEAGGVWNDTNLMQSLGFPRRDPLELKRSAGIGIRFFMPMIGQLGFDMGYGFDDISGDGEPQGWEYTIIFGR
ncbi:MAG: outer membrane protein assembly factor BamA [Candidatus Marinimicrobia bacterium]|jgi:outer membrane protein insertion porin family|nr:outer membrane protein assembly factor BamA [Candidatus Neomarinimicrobiota bacterium]MDP6992279.1 outer membrane protein assembly factor BamA [Candidatus Neomarinimicrobiota bacterium]